MSSADQTRADAPTLRLQKLYIKDLSFENPLAPGVFREASEPNVQLNLSLKNRKIDGEHWEVSLHLTATVTSGEKTVFLVELEHAGLFLLRNVPEEHLPLVLAVECPTHLFPFSRQIVCQVALDGGFMPFLMEPVNFRAMYEASRQQANAQSPH